MRTSIRTACSISLMIWSLAATAWALPERDVLVIAGAGVSQAWNTEFDLANPGPTPLTVEIGRLDVPLSEGQCPGIDPCIVAVDHRVIPPNGTIHTNAYSIGAGLVSTFYVVSPDAGGSLPVVHARTVDRNRPARGTDIPVVRRSTLIASGENGLSFPAAVRSASVHSNLVLAEISAKADLEVLVEVFSAEGERLAGQNFHVGRDNALGRDGTLFLVDILGMLGVSELDGGQIRVTKIGGTGLMWGLLANIYDEGRVSVSVGANP
ncbi:MAG TPA: hypothetical protein VF958_13835 [Thermoanaerobaculia bacterium]